MSMRNQYSFSEFLTTGLSFLMTKVTMPQARLIRRPVYLRGRRCLKGAEGLTTGHGCRFDLRGECETLRIGRNCEIGDYVHIVAHHSVTIGDQVLMASKIFISDTNHGSYSGEEQSSPELAPNERPLSHAPVVIGDKVWIGDNAVILAGTEIGKGCVIGANAVVHGHFGDNLILAGVPARPIKRYNEETKQWERI